MLFGTAKRLQLNPKQLELYYDQSKINVSETYTYLGSTLDSHLNLSENFDKKYKKASSKLKLLYNTVICYQQKLFYFNVQCYDSSCNQIQLYNSYEVDYGTREKT